MIKANANTPGVVYIASNDLSAITLLDTSPISPTARAWQVLRFPGNLTSAPSLSNATGNPATFTPPAAGETYVIHLQRTFLVGAAEDLYLAIVILDANGEALPCPGLDARPESSLLNASQAMIDLGFAGGQSVGLKLLDGVLRRVRAAVGSEIVYAGVMTATDETLGTINSVHNIAPGASIHVPNGVTLTLRGQLKADAARQIFQVDSEGSLLLPDVADVHPGWFGAAANANFLHTDFKWYTDSTHTVEATDDSAALRACHASVAGRAAALQQTTIHYRGPHYLKTPLSTPTGLFSNKPFFTVASFTTHRGEAGGALRLGPGLQTAEYAIFIGTTDLQSVRFEGIGFHCNADDTTSPSVGGHTTASSQRNPMIALLGAHNDDIRISGCLFEKHAGILPLCVADFTSANGDQLGKGIHIEDNTFREIGGVATLIDHITIYVQADGASITGNVFYNDPATNAHSKDFGSCFQIQGRSIAVAGNSFQNVSGLGLFCSFFGINSGDLSFVGNSISFVPVGISLCQAVGHTLSNIVVSGNSGTMTNCSAGQLEGFVQTAGLNGGDAGLDNLVVADNSIRFVRDARYAISQPIALSFDVSIRSMLVEGNEFSDWPSGGITISPVTGTNPNNKTPSPPWAPATLTGDDLKIWDLHIRNNRLKNCGIGAQSVNLACAGTNTPIRRVSVSGNVIEAVDRVLRVSNATNASPIVVTTCDEITGAALDHGIADGTKVTVSGVNGNIAADVTGYAHVLSSSTFALYSDAGLTAPIAGTGAYTSGGIVQCPQSGSITTGVVIAGGGLEDVDCDPDSNFFRNVTTSVAVSGSPLTRAYAGRRGVTLDDGTISQVRLSYDSNTFGAVITGSLRLNKPIALANAQALYAINQAGSAVYPLLELDTNDVVRIAPTARVVGIGPLVTVSGAAAGDLLLPKGNGVRRENNAQSAALLLLDSDSNDYARLGSDANVSGLKAYSAGALALQVDGAAVAVPGAAATIKMDSLPALSVATGVLQVGFSNSWTGLDIYNGAASTYGIRMSSSGVTLEHGGLVRLKAVASGISINAATGPSTGDSAVTLKAGNAPTTNPGANEVSIYVDIADGKLKARGSSGTVTILAVP